MCQGSETDKLCGAEKTVNHLLFHCPLSIYLWNVVKDGMGWSKIPDSVVDFTENFLLESKKKRNQILLFLFGAIWWTLWLTRNDWVFNDKLISSPTSIIFKLFFFMQQWKIISLGEDMAALEKLIEVLKAQVPMEMVPTGVG
jgi:hypothetical protein